MFGSEAFLLDQVNRRAIRSTVGGHTGVVGINLLRSCVRPNLGHTFTCLWLSFDLALHICLCVGVFACRELFTMIGLRLMC